MRGRSLAALWRPSTTRSPKLRPRTDRPQQGRCGPAAPCVQLSRASWASTGPWSQYDQWRRCDPPAGQALVQLASATRPFDGRRRWLGSAQSDCSESDPGIDKSYISGTFRDLAIEIALALLNLAALHPNVPRHAGDGPISLSCRYGRAELARLAQLVERATFDRAVAGSNPAAGNECFCQGYEQARVALKVPLHFSRCATSIHRARIPANRCGSVGCRVSRSPQAVRVWPLR